MREMGDGKEKHTIYLLPKIFCPIMEVVRVRQLPLGTGDMESRSEQGLASFPMPMSRIPNLPVMAH